MNDIIKAGELKIIKKVTAVGDFNLLLEFANGENRIFNATPLLEMSVFKPLKNKELFNKVHIVYDYTIGWNDEIDMCPDSLYRDSIPYNKTEN